MNESVFDRILSNASLLKIDPYADGLIDFINSENMSIDQIDAVCKVFDHLRDRQKEVIINTHLKMSRLPLKEPKTFDNFDFSNVHGKQVDALKNLPSLSALYARKNLAFIGPQGVGKTHLAMAFRFVDAVKYGREGRVIAGLVKPSCLIVDEIGRCVFNKESTRMFFDMIDRRYNKEGPNTIIFTSNKSPDKWGEFFSEDSSLLCALDRIFDSAIVFMMKGDSYRGKGLETIPVETGRSRSGVKLK